MLPGMITGLKSSVRTDFTCRFKEKYNSIKLAIKMLEHNKEEV